MNNENIVNTMFRVGDIVKLKSGGPSMTVKVLKITLYETTKGDIEEGFRGFIACTWFNNLQELKAEVFLQNMLMLAAENDISNKEPTLILNKSI